MLSAESKKIRMYLYNILLNNFEPFLRNYIDENILSYKTEWRACVPGYTINQASDVLKKNKYTIQEYLSTLFLSDLKNIMLYDNNFEKCFSLLGEKMTRDKFIEIMDKLIDTRDKVSHPYEINADSLEATIYRIRAICNNKNTARDILEYLDKSEYEYGVVPPPECINNLREPSYASAGGFIQRNETKIIINAINKKLNRIINIIGSGGVGKTAIAEYIANEYLSSQNNPFYAILFYSAKDKMLTEKGVVPVESTLFDYENFIRELYSNIFCAYENNKTVENCEKEIYDFVDQTKGNHRCLIIIDNLESPTIFNNKRLRKFIEEFPRDSQILLTSRVGTDMPEEKIKVVQMNELQAIQLLKRYSATRFRNRTTIYNLPDSELKNLVKKVYCIPLLVKVAVGKNIELGQNLELAFSVGNRKDKEAINFMLSETFAMLSPQARLFLECMALHKNIKISRAALIEMTRVFDSDDFESMFLQVEAVSLVHREIIDMEEIFVIDQIANRYVQDWLYANPKDNAIIRKRCSELYTRIEHAHNYLKENNIEGLSHELKESEYLAASHTAEAIKHNMDRMMDLNKKYEQALRHFNISIELAPWWYHTYIEFAFFEANWNHMDAAKELLEKAKIKNPKCEEYSKYRRVMKIINK